MKMMITTSGLQVRIMSGRETISKFLTLIIFSNISEVQTKLFQPHDYEKIPATHHHVSIGDRSLCGNSHPCWHSVCLLHINTKYHSVSTHSTTKYWA